MDTQVLREDGVFNYSRLINRGATASRGDVLASLNNEIEVEEKGWLREMVSHVLQPDVGAVGARLWFPDGTLQHGGVILGLGVMADDPFTGVPHGSPGYFDRLFCSRIVPPPPAPVCSSAKMFFRKQAALMKQILPLVSMTSIFAYECAS